MVQFKLSGLVCLGALLSAVACAGTEDDGTNTNDADAGTDADDESSTDDADRRDDGDDASEDPDESEDADSDDASEDTDDSDDADDTSVDVSESDDEADAIDNSDDDVEPDDVDESDESDTADDTPDDAADDTADDTGEVDGGSDEPSEDEGEVDAGAESSDEDDAASDGDAGANEPLPCEEGRAGDDCSECIRGLIDDGNGGCVEPCELLDCGNGICQPQEGDTAACLCDYGYKGSTCDSCAAGFQMVFRGETGSCLLDAPDTDDMVLWLDADHDASFDFDASGKVLRWYSRAGADTAFTDTGLMSARPSRIESGDQARNWVRFDGEDDRLHRLVDLSSGSYSIYMAVRTSDGAIDQTLLSGVQESSGDPGLRLVVRDGGQEVMVRHQMPFGDGNDQVTFGEFDLTTPGLVEVTRNPGILNLLALGNGTTASSVPSSTPAFGEELLLQIGVLHNGGIPYALEGDVAEFIIFSPAITSTSEATAIRNYLKAKWEL